MSSGVWGSMPLTLTAPEARDWMRHVHGLDRAWAPGRAGVRELLHDRRCIQLDPLDRIGTNADLVALARVDGLAKGDVYQALLPGRAFEHFAKERCLLPASAFPAYRHHAEQAQWWRRSVRLERVDPQVVGDVLAEVTERGPLTAEELTDRGTVKPLDWSGWRGTSRACKMALELLWLQCEVVVTERRASGTKVYDVPERALPDVHDAQPPPDFHRWALLHRVWAAGLLQRATGPQWGQLGRVRTTLPEALIEEGALIEVMVEGSRRRYLAPPELASHRATDPDDRVRILGPLDPLLWDRKLLQLAYGFEYIWEVYKPAAKRRWGYYVCPLLHRGALVGRIEGHVAEGALHLDQLWAEPGQTLDRDALAEALERHGRCLGAPWSGAWP